MSNEHKQNGQWTRGLRMAIGGAIVASLLALAPGVAAAAKPVNTEAPRINTTSRPHLNTVMTAEPGAWTGGPTFAYQWLRCESGGKELCSGIAGATGSTYTPAEADFGYRFDLNVTATNSDGSATATSPATAPLTARLSACRSTAAGKGVYEDSSCTHEGGSKSYKWQWASAGEMNFTGVTPYLISWQWGGIPRSVACTGAEGTGLIGDNSPGMTAQNLKLTLTGCSVTKPAGQGCTIPNGKVQLNPLDGEAITLGASPIIELRPQAGLGGSLGTITVQGCVASGSFPMNSAILYAQVLGSESTHPGSFMFTQHYLVMGGYNAYFEGASSLWSTGSLVTLRG